MKKIHAVPIPLWAKLGLSDTPPVPCEFALDQIVKYTNNQGAEFIMRVIGFSKTISPLGFIHLTRSHKDDEYGCAWWFPHKPEQLKAI